MKEMMKIARIKSTHRSVVNVGIWLLSLGLISLCMTGCESDSFSHKPPEGMGSLIVDNQTGDRLEVYVNGIETNRVSAYDYEASDLEPGVYRVVVQERHGSRSYRNDVDILDDKLTVMQVRWSSSYSYSVRIYFD